MVAAVGAGCAFILAAEAQPYPNKPVQIVVPYVAGGLNDAIARAVGQRLSDAWGQQVVVENKPGANSQIGAAYVAKAPADGYTLLASASPTFVVNQHLYRKLGYDPITDLAPISGLGLVNQALIATPSLPVTTVKGLIDLARSKSGEINYGTTGPGSTAHLHMITLARMTGTRFLPVHYRGAAPALTDVLGGHTQLMIVSAALSVPPWEGGKVKILGFGSANRLSQFPQVPTVAESGLPGYEASEWFGLAAPAGTPRDVIDKISAQVQVVFNDPTFRETFLDPNMVDSIAGPPGQLADRIRTESAKWEKLVRDAGVTVE